MKVEDDGVEATDTPPDQLDRYNEDLNECYKSIVHREWTAADYEKTYRQSLEVRDCLIAAGFAVPAETPSQQVFVEQYKAALSGGAPVWSPYDVVFADPDKTVDALKACPQPAPIF